MISESDRSDLIFSSIQFMETISRIYGADKGIELWSTIANTIEPDLKSQIFLHMLTGSHSSPKIHVRNPFMSRIENRVGIIRCIRTYDRRRLGLLEAKKIVDSLDNGGSVVLEVDPELNPTFKVELRKLNLVV